VPWYQNQQQTGRGRPFLPLRDAVFAVTFKVYSTVSARRFTCDLNDARERGYIAKAPHFNSIFNYLENPLMDEILKRLIVASSLPLKSVETDLLSTALALRPPAFTAGSTTNTARSNRSMIG